MSSESFTIHPKKKPAPKPVCFLVALGYVGILITMLVLTIQWVSGNSSKAIGVGICLAIMLTAPIVEKCFAWYIYADIKKLKDGLEYVFYGCLDGGLYHDRTYYTVHKIDKVQKKGNNLVIYGDCTIKETFSKTKPIGKFIIYDYTDEVKNLIEELGGKIE